MTHNPQSGNEAREWTLAFYYGSETIHPVGSPITLDEENIHVIEKSAFDRQQKTIDELRSLLQDAEKVIGQLCANGNLARSFSVDIKFLNETCVRIETLSRTSEVGND